jgi:hypothetical protein
MPVKEIETLLDNDIHESRVGALSIMAKQYPLKTTTTERRKELYDLYMRRHGRINNWDLVDLAAWHVVGPWLVDKPRGVLHRLAKSKNMWERRTAILATFSFIKRGEFGDTIKIAKLLIKDDQDLRTTRTSSTRRLAGPCASSATRIARCSTPSSKSTPPKCLVQCSAMRSRSSALPRRHTTER